MDNDLEQLKTHPRVMEVYSHYLKLRKEGDKYLANCVFHSEKSASLTIYAKDSLYFCYGCQAKGNIFMLVQHVEGCDFKTAVEKVRGLVGETKWEQNKALVEQTFKSVAETNKEYKVFPLSAYQKYESNLKASQPAQDWLASRGITLETALRLHTGFIADVGGKAGQNNADIAGGGWVCFPTLNGDTVTSIKYRSIVRKAFCKQGGMSTELYNTEGIDPFEDVLLVEGEVDAMTLEQAGFRAVSLASASSHPTPQQKDLLMRANRVFLAGDCDGAVGEVIMAKLWRELEERTYLLKWPDGMKDANQTYLEKCKGDLSIFRTTVEGLVHEAVKQPLPDVYSLKEVMVSSQQGSLVDHPLRFRWPQPDVDKMAILLPGSVWGLTATSTGMGKTQFSIQGSMHNALKYGARVLNWQCELSPEEVSTIVTAQVLKKDRNTLTVEDKKTAADILGDVEYYIGHNPNISNHNEVLDLIEAAVKRLSITHVLLDTFDNIVSSENNTVNIESSAANRIKNMSMKYGLIWGNIFQPRKAQQQNRGKKTQISDIRGSASAGNTCDTVYAIHRELSKSDDGILSDDVYESRTLLHLNKTRAKGVGKAETYIQFFGALASFEQIDYTHEEPQ